MSPRPKKIIGIDVGGTKISAGLVDHAGRILERAKAPTPRKGGPARVVSLFRDLIDELLTEADARKGEIGGLGIGIPGLVDASAGRVIATPNMNLSGVPLARIAKKRFGWNVLIGNDVDVGLLAEKHFGAARGIDDALGIFVGTGVGGSILAGGRLIRGQQGAAAELGHMIIDPRGPLCSCGNRGCLEAFAGRWAMERDIRAAVKKGEKTILKKLTEGRLKMIKSRVLRKALKKGDRLTERVMGRASIVLGQACVSLRHIFDPQIMIFGGGVIEACGDFMLPLIARCLRQDPFFRKLRPCRVVVSELGDDAVILGAAAMFLAGKK